MSQLLATTLGRETLSHAKGEDMHLLTLLIIFSGFVFVVSWPGKNNLGPVGDERSCIASYAGHAA
jgi:hypothetical protein